LKTVLKDRLRHTGFGETKPMDTNKTAAGKAQQKS
jgi:flagellar motor protein MotB